MAALVCGLTGASPEEPVFSRTGYIFEKRTIEKYLKTNGNICPLSGDPLTPDDLTPIKANKSVKPRPATATSIPGLLALMQNEWDSLMVETFSLRNHLDAVRQQLSHSLYQHDAACRVIARLIKERDGLRHQLSQLHDQVTHSAALDVPLGASGGDVGVSSEVIEEWKSLAKSLLSQRKKRNLEGLAPLEKIQSWGQSGSYSIHSTTTPGVTCCAYDPKSIGTRSVWTAGVDGLVAFFDFDQQKTVGRLLGHLKKVNQIIPHPTENLLLSASDDKTVRVWSSHDGSPNDFKTSWILRRHQKSVTSISLHPSGDYFSSGSRDETWAIHDLHSGLTCKTFTELPCEFSNVSFHPDGMLVGAAGVNSKIYIYDVKASSDAMVSLSGHEGPLTSLQFSENGYYLATAAEDGKIKLWDLRKSLNFETVQPLTETSSAFSPSKIQFDSSGNYLAICGSATKARSTTGYLSVYHFESRTQLQEAILLDGHLDRVTDACFGPNAEYLVSCSMDRSVRLWNEQESRTNT